MVLLARAQKKDLMQMASSSMFPHDPRIIRKQGEKKRSSIDMEVHRQGEEMEEGMENIPALGS
jgi:hypothetical protein